MSKTETGIISGYYFDVYCNTIADGVLHEARSSRFRAGVAELIVEEGKKLLKELEA